MDKFEELYGSAYKQEIIRYSHPDWHFIRLDGILYLATYDEEGRLESLNHGGAIVYRRLETY